MKFIARVVTNEGTFSHTVINPLHAPTPLATMSAIRIAERDRDTEVVHPVHDPRREEEDLAGRQIDLGEHEQQHLSDGDGRDRSRVARRRAEAELVGEGRSRPDREVAEQANRDHDRRQLALIEEGVQDPPAERP